MIFLKKKKKLSLLFFSFKKKGFVNVHLLKFNIRSLKILMGDLLKEVVFTFFFLFLFFYFFFKHWITKYGIF